MSGERVDLLACPWPHPGRELHEGGWPAKHQYWVHCPCGAMGPICDSPEKARERWNTRTPAAMERTYDDGVEDAAKVCDDAFGDDHPHDTANKIRALKSAAISAVKGDGE